VALDPAPDLAFMMAFDEIVDPIKHPRYKGWGGVVLARGHVVVTDVRTESAQDLRTFLDNTVREANRLAVDNRERERQHERAQAAARAKQKARKATSAQAAAEHDIQLTDTFRDSG
jgi:hypothetical protein